MRLARRGTGRTRQSRHSLPDCLPSGTQVGTHAPVLAGLAVTVSALTVLPDGVRAMRPDEGLPRLPEFGIIMLKGRNAAQPVTDALAVHIEERFRTDFASMAAA